MTKPQKISIIVSVLWCLSSALIAADFSRAGSVEFFWRTLLYMTPVWGGWSAIWIWGWPKKSKSTNVPQHLRFRELFKELGWRKWFILVSFIAWIVLFSDALKTQPRDLFSEEIYRQALVKSLVGAAVGFICGTLLFLRFKAPVMNRILTAFGAGILSLLYLAAYGLWFWLFGKLIQAHTVIEPLSNTPSDSMFVAIIEGGMNMLLILVFWNALADLYNKAKQLSGGVSRLNILSGSNITE